MKRRRVLALPLAAAAGLAAAHAPRRSAAELMDVLMWNREPVGGPFQLVDQHGRRRTDADFRGRLMLVYFGYTSCADVCPTDLQQMALLLGQLGDQAPALQPLFITLDPARDTSRQLDRYVSAFDPRIVALTGSPAAIRRVADAYRVAFRKVQLPSGGYGIDHASFLFLMDRDGKYLGFFPPGTSADRLLTVVRPHLAER